MNLTRAHSSKAIPDSFIDDALFLCYIQRIGDTDLVDAVYI